MAFDKSLDRTLIEDTYENENAGDLTVSVVAYNEGSPKLQIGPRLKVTKEGPKHVKAGRMNRDEVVWLQGLLEEWIPEYLDKEKVTQVY